MILEAQGPKKKRRLKGKQGDLLRLLDVVIQRRAREIPTYLPNLRVHLLGPLALPVLVYLRYQVRPVPKVPQDQDTVLDQAHTDR